jgi:CHAT domain-containing protein
MTRGITDELAAARLAMQQAYEKGDHAAASKLNDRIESLDTDLKAHVARLRKDYPTYAAALFPGPTDLSQIPLQDDEWALVYHVTDKALLIYLIKGHRVVKAISKDISRKDLHERVRRLRAPLEMTDSAIIPDKLKAFDFVTAKGLCDLLLADCLSDLPEQVPVIIVPDHCLATIPFEMLVLNDGGRIVDGDSIPRVTDAKFFGDRNTVSYCQSLTVLAHTRLRSEQARPGPRTMVIADPIMSEDDSRVRPTIRTPFLRYEVMSADVTSMEQSSGIWFARLPLTHQLAQSLQRLDPNTTDVYLGSKATKSTLIEKPLEQYGTLVIATNGYFGSDLPGIREPVLVLSLVDQPRGQDGFLRMSEVMGLKLNADLVALVAGQTGLGKMVPGEGVLSMGRAFQYAGARSTLVSLWAGAEGPTVQLVESFFQHLKGGHRKKEALKRARNDLRMAGFDHPFFWASFILVGDVK